MGLLMPFFILFMVLGIPIAFAMGIAALAVLLMDGSFPLSIVAQRTVLGTDSFSLLAIPFFILAGHLMNNGGITERIIHFANTIVGRFTGGLGLSAVSASMLISGVSGSAVADVTAIGTPVIPSMIKQGYGKGFSAGLIATASMCGPLIPPSIPFVIYGISITGVSIGGLFIAGAIPGVMLGIALMIMAYFISKRRGYPKYDAVPLKEIAKAGYGAMWALFMPVIILWGILSGIVTVTESAAIAVLYAFIVGFFVYRELQIKHLMRILQMTGLESALVMIIIGIASLMGWVLTISQITDHIAGLLLGISENPVVILLLIVVLLLIVGMFMETVSSMILLIPVLVPVVTAVGVDLTHFGVIMVYTLCIGLITPPVGICLYITQRLAGERIDKVVKESLPFLGAALAVLLLLILVPDLVTWLPELLMKQ